VRLRSVALRSQGSSALVSGVSFEPDTGQNGADSSLVVAIAEYLDFRVSADQSPSMKQMSVRVPLQDLHRSAQMYRQEYLAAMDRVLQRGWYIMGQELKEFEKEWGGYLKADFCVGCGNGTDALELALRACGIGMGDHVVTAANAGMYATTAIISVGAIPIYADIETGSYAVSERTVLDVVDEDTKAVIVTHLYGIPAPIDNIKKICKARSLLLIEDCAECHGAQTKDGRFLGTVGDVGCFSFYPTKNLGALGDGGACVTSNVELAERLRNLRQYGWRERYQAAVPFGRNSRLDEIQAAALRVMLPQLENRNKARRKIAECYVEAFRGLELVLPPADDPGYVAHLFVIQVDGRDAIRTKLAECGVATDIHFPTPDYRQPAVLAAVKRKYGDLRETERVVSRILTLPCFPEMTEAEVDHVIQAVQTVLQ